MKIAEKTIIKVKTTITVYTSKVFALKDSFVNNMKALGCFK